MLLRLGECARRELGVVTKDYRTLEFDDKEQQTR
jgi:hypothetical protein